MYRSIVEGIALTMSAASTRCAPSWGSRSTQVVVSGGGAASPLIMQIFADVFGIPAARRVGRRRRGLGAAICAAVGAGLPPTSPTAAPAMVRPARGVRPRPGVVGLYARLAETVYHGDPRRTPTRCSSPPTRSSTERPPDKRKDPA